MPGFGVAEQVGLKQLKIGEQFARARNWWRISQRDLAKSLFTSHSVIVKLEKDDSNLELKTLVRTAMALGCKLEVRLVPDHLEEGRKELKKQAVD